MAPLLLAMAWCLAALPSARAVAGFWHVGIWHNTGYVWVSRSQETAARCCAWSWLGSGALQPRARRPTTLLVLERQDQGPLCPVQIFFPAIPGVPPAAYSVQRSDTADFRNFTAVQFTPVLNPPDNTTYTVMDNSSKWTRVNATSNERVRPFYRVALLVAPVTSPPAQTVDAKGETWPPSTLRRPSSGCRTGSLVYGVLLLRRRLAPRTPQATPLCRPPPWTAPSAAVPSGFRRNPATISRPP
jgi:hypothetical protein